MGRILLAEDDPRVGQLLKSSLERLGHACEHATNGRQALTFLENEKFDLIVTDLVMPEVDGIEIITQIRKISPEIKILAMSGGSAVPGTGLLAMARALGADLVLSKPFSTDELSANVQFLLSSKGS